MIFSEEVINWYLKNKRDLPWRDTNDAYIIWLSEIIMQQTRVEQGMPYFNRFLENYPTVSHFASATEDEILKLWQGLGYYSRGRNMHYTANLVMDEHGGYFPTSYDKLIKLKGVGEYTAAAIASFSVGEAKAVVDGNVFRLLSRYFGVDIPINSTKGKKTFGELADEIMDREQPGIYNQAVMEFGALQCKPFNPDCPTCPLRPGCYAFRNRKVKELPVKLKQVASKDRYFYYFVVSKNNRLLVNKRGANDIWQNLYELPLFETSQAVSIEELLASPEVRSNFGDVLAKKITGPIKHVLSHQNLHATFIEIQDFEERFASKMNWQYVDYEEVRNLAQPKLIFSFLNKFLN
ncbi:A/G-specific adenine glycosylase [Pedobacter sp. HMF7647]|uniref:Adenine DNA glycosylase n=1 Tax=Hufsiella arboris TaxID=2695275 RepID=A0A7K1YAJ8_9SPHI|nr:A/G-specific adenine glycosylase [Hufsiella arboris]MXV51594.1 A/G-specific adenine glycosylase [Hufsiella arboris]